MASRIRRRDWVEDWVRESAAAIPSRRLSGLSMKVHRRRLRKWTRFGVEILGLQIEVLV